MSFVFFDFKVTGDEWGPRPLAILELDDDGADAVAAPQLAKAPAAIPCLTDPVGEALRQEGEDVEDG